MAHLKKYEKNGAVWSIRGDLQWEKMKAHIGPIGKLLCLCNVKTIETII